MEYRPWVALANMADKRQLPPAETIFYFRKDYFIYPSLRSPRIVR
jgi:hypothetical protein